MSNLTIGASLTRLPRLTRRQGLALTAAAASAALLAACTSAQVSQITTDLNLVQTGVTNLSAALAAAGVVVPAAVNADVAAASAAIVALLGATSPTATLWQNLNAGIGVLVTAVTPFFPMAPAVAGIVQAIAVVVQGLLASNGVLATFEAHPAGATMTLVQARALLAGLAH